METIDRSPNWLVWNCPWTSRIRPTTIRLAPRACAGTSAARPIGRRQLRQSKLARLRRYSLHSTPPTTAGHLVGQVPLAQMCRTRNRPAINHLTETDLLRVSGIKTEMNVGVVGASAPRLSCPHLRAGSEAPEGPDGVRGGFGGRVDCSSVAASTGWAQRHVSRARSAATREPPGRALIAPAQRHRRQRPESCHQEPRHRVPFIPRACNALYTRRGRAPDTRATPRSKGAHSQTCGTSPILLASRGHSAQTLDCEPSCGDTPRRRLDRGSDD